VTDRRRYVTPGTHIDLITHGRKRLLPFFAGPLSDIDGERSREGLATMVELVDDGELSPRPSTTHGRICPWRSVKPSSED